MNYLCIETSNINGFISLFSDQKKVKEISWKSEKHSEKLIESLKPFLNQKIDFIAVDIGPGRFTGIRLGVNCAKTLSYVWSCPLLPCISLRILCEPYLNKTQKPVLCLMEAFGNKFYVAVYQKVQDKVKTLLEPVSFSKDQLEKGIDQPVLCVGDVYKKKKHLFSEKTQSLIEYQSDLSIQPETFSKVVQDEYNKQNLKQWFELEPLYLRVPEVFNLNG